jgi:hypothetical protein
LKDARFIGECRKKLCAVFHGKFCGFEKQWKEESIKAKKWNKTQHGS